MNLNLEAGRTEILVNFCLARSSTFSCKELVEWKVLPNADVKTEEIEKARRGYMT